MVIQVAGTTDPGDALNPPVTRILGVPVHRVNMGAAVRQILSAVGNGRGQFVCVRDVHGIMQAVDSPDLMAIHERAGLVVPDGMPLVWICHARGFQEVGRVSGSDLVDALCAASVAPGVSHYFYGGRPGVAEEMAAQLSKRHPGLIVAGCSTPPFRALDEDEEAAELATINAAPPGVVWVGLSTPKQERWMARHVGRIPGATLIGVGAAFDFHTGLVRRAPPWMQRSGLEWLHRLAQEPRRLWRRYLILAPRFVIELARRRDGRR